MTILHLDQKGLTNFDNCIRLEVNGRYITAFTVDGQNHHVAVCESSQQAESMFMDIARELEKHE